MSDPASSPTQVAGAPPPAPVDPFVGALVGERYRLLARIGEGGMGAVYRAEHTLMKKVVAVKLLHAELGQMDEAMRRFEREAQSASRLNHPNIIAVTDFGRAASGELYLVMEYLAGKSLAAALEAGRFPVGRAVAVARQILRALSHAHAQGVVHRDLKPANIMVCAQPDGSAGELVKILDFGIAKMSQGIGEGERQLTQGAMIFGTPSYMSPEQATAQDADSRTDIYSCGVMLYEMLAGRKPFIADDLVKIMAMQVTAAPPPFATAAPEARIPAAIEAVVMCALEKDRVRRFATAAAFIAALDEAASPRLAARLPAALRSLSSLSAGVGAVVDRSLARLPRRARRWVPLSGGVLAVVLALLFIPLVCMRDDHNPGTTPPAPRALEPALKTPLARVEEAIGKGQLPQARLLLMQQVSAHPQSARVRQLLGQLEFAEKQPSAGLDAYAAALKLDPGLRADAALLINVRSLLDDRKLARPALDLIIGHIGKPAADVLVELANDDRRADFRQDARAACEELGCAARIDRVKSYGLDLSQGKSCEDKRQAVKNLAATKDARAIEPLKKARSASGMSIGGLRFRGFAGGNDCIRKDIDAALKDLGA